jgi:cytochrome c
MVRFAVVALAAGLGWCTAAAGQDVAQAEAVLKKSGCMKCHAVSAKKEGPSFKDVAAKYKGKPTASRR